MPTIGETFRTARESKGVSLSEAGQATRIKTQQLDALERDDFRGIPAPTYARGFIKLYAQFLQLDPAPLLEQYNARQGKPPPAPTPVPSARPPARPPAGGRPAFHLSAPAALSAEAPAAAASAPVVAPAAPEPFAPILPVSPGTVSEAARPENALSSSPLTDTPVSPDFPAPGLAEIPSPAPGQEAPGGSGGNAPFGIPFADPISPLPVPGASPTAPAGDAPADEPMAPARGPGLATEADRQAYKAARLRQAAVVVAGSLLFVFLLWGIRKLMNGDAPRAGDLAGASSRPASLIADPPEPYLEGR